PRAGAARRPPPRLPPPRASALGPARPAPPPPFGLLDHRHADAILDAPAGIERFHLRQDARGQPGSQALQPDQGGTTDRREDRGRDPTFHDLLLRLPCRTRDDLVECPDPHRFASIATP